MARIYVTEPGTTGGVGGMGMRILVQSLRDAGHEVTRVRLFRDVAGGEQPQLFGGLLDEQTTDATRLARPDAWFVSTIYPRQWADLPDMFRRIGLAPVASDRKSGDPLVAFGGQAMIAPEPIADLADLVALGDGEATGIEIGRLLNGGAERADIMNQLDGRRGFYIPSKSPLSSLSRLEVAPSVHVIHADPERPKDVPMIEVARGCASKCAFCPIGWAGGTYREASKDAIAETLIKLRGKRVNMFAPDMSSVSWVDDLDRAIQMNGCTQTGRDARLDAAARHLARGGGVKQYSFGIEGLSERLRRAIGKPLATQKIVDTMRALGAVRQIVWYVILGLPGETDADLAEFLAMCGDVRLAYKGKLDITFTHLQPVPHTPLQWIDGHYQPAALARHSRLRETFAGWWKDDGTKILASGFKGLELHEHDTWLQRADRRASAYLLALNGNKAKLADGRWRDVATTAGLDVDRTLGQIEPGALTPWSHVQIAPLDKLTRAWATYQRLLS